MTGPEGIVPTAWSEMLTIRPAQMQVLAAPFAERFATYTVGRVAAQFAPVAAVLGDAGLRVAVVHGIARAEHHGIDGDADVLGYLALMFTFGRDFDVALPWAASALAAPGDGAVRMGTLRALAQAHASAARGYLSSEDARGA